MNKFLILLTLCLVSFDVNARALSCGNQSLTISFDESGGDAVVSLREKEQFPLLVTKEDYRLTWVYDDDTESHGIGGALLIKRTHNATFGPFKAIMVNWYETQDLGTVGTFYIEYAKGNSVLTHMVCRISE
ncbi:hypothetical protein D3C87_1319670 [compost metagenome]